MNATRPEWWLAYCRFCERLREILLTAPWSSLDLIMASSIFLIGAYLLSCPRLFDHYGSMYGGLSKFGGELLWGAAFLVAGAFGLLSVLWMVRPPFLVRLLARMAIAFCLLSQALNTLAHAPPPLSAIMYGVLSMAALWSLWRTKPSGR